MTGSIVVNRRRKKRIGTITIPKDKALLVCISILFYVYFIGFFTYNFGVPETAYYVTDILIVTCLCMSLMRTGRVFFSKRLKMFSALLVLLFVIYTGSAFINGFKLLLWMWSLRNWGRFFAYFYLCCALLNEKWIDNLLRITINLFFINVVVIAIQYFIIKGYAQDSLNGLLGRNTSGANTVLTMAAAIIVSAEYVSKKCTLKKVVLVFTGVLVVSILAELKAIILFAFLIFGAVVLVNSRLSLKHIFRVMLLIILAIIASIFALRTLARIYPEFAKILSIEGLIGAVTTEGGYGNVGRIDRLTAISVVNRDLFKGGFIQQLFGIGMGNAEYSTSASLTSAFYLSYGLLYRYLGFCVAMLYIEGGYVGFGLYVTLFVVIIINCVGVIKRLKEKQIARESCYYESIGLGMALLGFIYIWYNNLLRTDMAVLMAFYMAIPFVLSRKGARCFVKFKD